MPSRRTGWSRAPSRLAELTARVGASCLDLTESNPTRAGLEAPDLVALLGDGRGARYAPEPLGHPMAREAVAGYYAARGVTIDPSRVVITASTSEAYAWLFKLLADPGDTVLVPSPSYPLLPYLADLESVRLERYPLLREERWRIDLAAVERALVATRARAVTVVHPGNPTGAFTRRDEAEALAALARRHDAALVVDEVFADYPAGPTLPADRLPTFAGTTGGLTFIMSGLSKVALLPQLKLGWIVVGGEDEALVAEALARLEIVADSYLSVGTPVQLALPDLLAAVPRMQARARRRLAQNLEALDAALFAAGPESPLRRVPFDGGFYALVEVPRTRSDDEWLERTLEAGVLVHPGYAYDMPGPPVVVMSLLTDEASFAEGLARAVPLWARG